LYLLVSDSLGERLVVEIWVAAEWAVLDIDFVQRVWLFLLDQLKDEMK
jgi:hypothetical protein